MSISETHKGWSSISHLNAFDRWNKMGNLEFLYKYEALRSKAS